MHVCHYKQWRQQVNSYCQQIYCGLEQVEVLRGRLDSANVFQVLLQS